MNDDVNKAMIFVLLCICIVVITVSLVYETQPEVTHVIDGDTIEVKQDGVELVRLAGIDAPESDECYGKEARNFLARHLDSRVTLKQADTDRGVYGRLIRYVHSSDTDMGAEMVEHGYARASDFPHPREEEYDRLEEQAKNNNKGLWRCT